MKRSPTVILLPLLVAVRLAGAVTLARAADPPAAGSPAAEEAAPRENKPLNLNLPLAIGDPASAVRIPQYGEVGQLLSLLNSVTVKRLDESRLELQGTDLDLNKPDGKTDFHIRLPRAIFDTRTRLLTSLEPVVISTADFELQGERMEFDTAARRGQFAGWVYMKIHGAKGTTLGAVGPEKPAPARPPVPAVEAP